MFYTSSVALLGCQCDKIKFLSFRTRQLKVQLSFYSVQNHPRSRLGGQNGLWMAYSLLLGRDKEKSRCRVVCKILRGENRNNSPKQSPFIAAVINFARPLLSRSLCPCVRVDSAKVSRTQYKKGVCVLFICFMCAGQWTIIIPGP